MKKFWLQILISVSASVLILWFLLNLVSDESNPIRLADLTGIYTEIPVTMFLTFLAIHLVGVVVRTVRFRVLIRAAQSETVPGFMPLALVTLVRNMTVDMLPARVGELFYVGLLNRGLGVRLDVGFSSLAVSVWFDVMVIIPLVGGLILFPALDAIMQKNLLVLIVLLVFVSVLGILILYPGLGIAARWLGRFEHSDSRLLKKLFTFVSQFSESVKNSLDLGTILKTFFLTVGVRLFKYSSIVILFSAIARAGFPELADADTASIVIALLASEAGASLPIPTFMSFGTYEAGGLIAFSMLGMPVAAAGLALFAIHVVTQAVDYTLGGISLIVFMAITGMRPSRIGQLE